MEGISLEFWCLLYDDDVDQQISNGSDFNFDQGAVLQRIERNSTTMVLLLLMMDKCIIRSDNVVGVQSNTRPSSVLVGWLIDWGRQREKSHQKVDQQQENNTPNLPRPPPIIDKNIEHMDGHRNTDTAANSVSQSEYSIESIRLEQCAWCMHDTDDATTTCDNTYSHRQVRATWTNCIRWWIYP